MLRRFGRSTAFANACSLLALTIAVGTGGAYAANTVFSTDIVDGEVKTADLDADAVTTFKLGNGAVHTNNLGVNSVTGDKVAADAIGSGSVNDESLTSNDLATNSVNATEVADGAIDSGEIFDDSLLDTDLASGSVRSPEIQDGQVATADLGSNSVTSAKVASNTLTSADIVGASSSGHVSLSGIPNGRCTQVNFGVSGAQVGQVAWVATGAAIQNGIVLYAQRVSAANTVEVDACNFSGTAMTAISDFPVRVITFG